MMIRTEPFVPAKFISEGTVKLRGIQIPYKTVCELIMQDYQKIVYI